MRLPWAVMLLALLAGRYVFWRCTATLNLDSPLAAALSLLLLAAELWLLAHGFLQLLFTLAPAQSQAPASPDPKQAANLPWVDVLVPSYGEPIEVVERCLRGCRALNYGRFRLWLLDDSGRPELAELCKGLGTTAAASGGSMPRPATSTMYCRSCRAS
jgi:cellulose synthase (UDP-forming)